MPPKKNTSFGNETKISTDAFYGEYHGHTMEHLLSLEDMFHSTRPFIFLAGDSSMDSKFWLPEHPQRKAVNGYERILTPPKCAPDVAYSVNAVISDLYREMETTSISSSNNLTKNNDKSPSLPPLSSYLCVNGAVEESTVAARYNGQLLPQDEFIRDHMQSNDILIVSIGGNDIALKPSLATMASMAGILISSAASVDNGTAYGLGHIIQMFRDDTQQYIMNLCSKTKPRAIIVCTIYYPHCLAGNSWADFSLSVLRYNSNPEILQRAIRSVYNHATSKIQIPGTEVIYCPLFDVLDPAEKSKDYIQRVEPSEQGGKKIAHRFIELLSERMNNAEAVENDEENNEEHGNDDEASSSTAKRKKSGNRKNQKRSSSNE